MKVLFLSCHSVLEWDLLTLFTELDNYLPEDKKLNIEIFSMGAYSNPTQSGDYLRSVIPHGKFYPELYQIYMQCDKDNIHDELLDWCDVVFFMHNAAVPGDKHQQPWVAKNWKKIKEKNKKSIWYSIGQCTPAIERELKPFREKGMNIIRHSPIEEKIPEFAGQDDVIRFYKDPEEFNNWQGDKLEVMTLSQSFKKRGDHLGFSIFDRVTANFKRRVYGTGNEDLGEINGGEISYQHLKNELKECRVFYYFGTVPVPYTLSFIEAMMTGIPVVAVGPKLREHKAYQWPNYEVPEIISNGVNGFWSDNYDELTGYIDLLMKDKDKAKSIGEAGRQTAIDLFSKEKIAKQWIDLFKRI